MPGVLPQNQWFGFVTVAVCRSNNHLSNCALDSSWLSQKRKGALGIHQYRDERRLVQDVSLILSCTEDRLCLVLGCELRSPKKRLLEIAFLVVPCCLRLIFLAVVIKGKRGLEEVASTLEIQNDRCDGKHTLSRQKQGRFFFLLLI